MFHCLHTLSLLIHCILPLQCPISDPKIYVFVCVFYGESASGISKRHIHPGQKSMSPIHQNALVKFVTAGLIED